MVEFYGLPLENKKLSTEYKNTIHNTIHNDKPLWSVFQLISSSENKIIWVVYVKKKIEKIFNSH